VTTARLLLAEPPDSSIPIAAELRETFRVLDVVATGWIVVLSFTTTAPPSAPNQGDAYLVPAGATGAWAGHQNHVAIFTPVGWIFRSPRPGWIAVIADQNLPYGRVLQYSGTAWTGWILPASQVSFDPSPTSFVSTDLQSLMEEINARFIADEANADALQDELDNHETRIDALEAAGGGGSGFTNVVTQSFAVNTTGFTSNGSGTWAIAGGVLKNSTSTTNGAVFYYTTPVPYVAIRLMCDVLMESTGLGGTGLVGMWYGPAAPAAVPTNSIDVAFRKVGGTTTIEEGKFGISTPFTAAHAFAVDTWYNLELVIVGNRHIMFVDGVVVSSYLITDTDAVSYQTFGVFSYDCHAQFKNFTIDTALAP
jgi:hypothetical protein